MATARAPTGVTARPTESSARHGERALDAVSSGASRKEAGREATETASRPDGPASKASGTPAGEANERSVIWT